MSNLHVPLLSKHLSYASNFSVSLGHLLKTGWTVYLKKLLKIGVFNVIENFDFVGLEFENKWRKIKFQNLKENMVYFISFSHFCAMVL